MKPRCRIPLIDVGVDLQRFWREFSPDPVHVPDWGEPPCRASPSGRRESNPQSIADSDVAAQDNRNFIETCQS